VAEPGEVTHPAADRVTPEALVVEQDRSLVPLTGWLIDAARAATSSGRLLQLLTPPESHLSYPLELLCGDGAVQWVRRAEAGFQDGFTGAPMGWTGARFVPVDGPVPPIPAADVRSGGLELQVTTWHPVVAGPVLGDAVRPVWQALTGSAPTGWGIDEPVTQLWSAGAEAEVTAACRDRAPVPTALVVAGAGAVGRLHVSRVDTGLIEELRVSGPAAPHVAQAALDDLAAVLAGTVRSAVVSVHPTRVSGVRPPVPSPPAVPYALLVGRAQVARRGVEHARVAPAGRVRLIDGAAWCRLEGDAPYEQLAALHAHFG
jgi:Family of unknown function (DUF6177)